MTDAHAALLRAASEWIRLGESEHEALASLFAMREVAARTALARPGSTRYDVLFVARGLLRFYYPGEDGRESNKAFVAEGEFAGALASARLGVPLLYGIEALEDTTVLAAPYEAFAALMDREPVFERLGRRLAETILARKERRTRAFLLQSATERYLDLSETRPDLLQRVPQYHLASYLGVTDVHLSRIRRELAERAVSEPM
ncbi:MAG: Crp/Fnr family transcriptional regulator [Bacteroidota bacterium]